MNQISEEQAVVLKHTKNGQNTIVDAVAGSGKSTTVLSIAAALPSRKIIQFTYNSMLRCEIKEKTAQLEIANLDIHTYHSMAVKYYYSSAHTDTGIRHILATKMKPRIHIPKKDIIVIDEAQDMTPLYFSLIIKYTMDMKHPFQLLVLGDFMQGLYDFKGADTRFLTLASKIWASHPYLKTSVFNECVLKTSYRITNQMSSFINNVMLGETRLVSCREGPLKVHYFRNLQKNLENTVIYHINKLLFEGAQPSDFFILGASVKGPNSPIRKMENVLVERGIPCHVPMFESDTIDEKVINKKVVFCTFHSVKGRQRKYVFILGFDQGYMRFYGKNLPQDQCPSTLYVATTRGTHGLFLLERTNFETDRPLEFLKKDQFEMRKMPTVEFKGTPYFPLYKTPEIEIEEVVQKHLITPTDLIKFIPETVLEEITPILNTMFKIIQPKGIELDIPTVIETQGGFFEEVSDLNGLAIPAMYYDCLSAEGTTNVLYEMILIIMDEFKDHEHAFLKSLVSQLPTEYKTPADYLFLANVYTAFQEKLYFKLKQITCEDYKWLTEDMFKKCKGRLNRIIGPECETARPLIEKTIIHQSQELEHESIDLFLSEYFINTLKFRFTARADLITQTSMWEIKCVREITMDHQLQVVIYAWLLKMKSIEKDVKIYNIRTGEIQRLDATKEELDYIVVSLLQGKYQQITKKNDEEFLEDCRRIITEA